MSRPDKWDGPVKRQKVPVRTKIGNMTLMPKHSYTSFQGLLWNLVTNDRMACHGPLLPTLLGRLCPPASKSTGILGWLRLSQSAAKITTCPLSKLALFWKCLPPVRPSLQCFPQDLPCSHIPMLLVWCPTTSCMAEPFFSQGACASWMWTNSNKKK